MEPSDAELVRQCLQGDNRGFDHLVRRYQRQVASFCYRVLGDTDQAADGAQTAFIKAYYALDCFRQDASFLTWLFRIASNTCRDAARKQTKRRIDSLDEPESGLDQLQSGEASPEGTVLEAENDRLLHAAILRLPIRYRAPLVMFYFHNMTLKNIAESLGRPEGTAKSDLHIAREMLRRKLEGVVVEL